MAKIYYAGDWAVLSGPIFYETPFQQSTKGLELYNYGIWLKSALESSGAHEVHSVPAWDFYRMGPGEYERVIEAYDVLIFSDIEGKLFQLAPSFFDREKFGTQVLTYPDRVRLTVEAVHSGKRMMFLGGWYSFTGQMGKGGWGRTHLQDILPVRCLEYEDLVESTEGYTASVTEEGRKSFDGIDFNTMPPILGYNETVPIKGCPVLIGVKETNHPLVAARDVGRGRVLVYTSDPAPHWGCNFVFWSAYNAFWQRCLTILMSEK